MANVTDEDVTICQGTTIGIMRATSSIKYVHDPVFTNDLPNLPAPISPHKLPEHLKTLVDQCNESITED
jgi:hypothetical protein